MVHPAEDNLSHTQLSSNVFEDLLESIIVDVASECHRIARLGLERNLEEEEEELRLSALARAGVADSGNSSEANNKFAPHLEKCMGKGRKARLKATRSSTAAQGRQTRGSSANMNRLSNGVPGAAGDEFTNGTFEESSR
uniref:SAGA-associated factor 11 n=1 Tax=Kalanchoe fedtschenkoi TaxID=63787 RepID=A0A7N0RGT0_KALFE